MSKLMHLIFFGKTHVWGIGTQPKNVQHISYFKNPSSPKPRFSGANAFPKPIFEIKCLLTLLHAIYKRRAILPPPPEIAFRVIQDVVAFSLHYNFL